MEYAKQLDKEKHLPDWIYVINEEFFRGMMHAGKRKQKGHDIKTQLINNTSSGSPVSSCTRSRTQLKDKTVQNYSKNQYRHIKALKQHNKSPKQQYK